MKACCTGCSSLLCPGDLFCGQCGEQCDPDATRGFLDQRKTERGDTIQVDWDLLDGDGNPLNLGATGVKIWFTMKRYLGDADQNALVQVTYVQGGPAGGIIPRDVLSSGHVMVTVPASVTVNFPEGISKIYYDLQVLDDQGRVTTVEKGVYLISPDVTRAIA